MQNFEIAWIFSELADLLEIKGEDFFKVRAYRRAAKALARLEQPVQELYRSGKLSQVPGIGKAIAAKIKEIIETGKLAKHQELLKEIPAGVLAVRQLPGIGAGRARALFKELAITDLTELEQAAKERKVRSLKGFSAKLESDILHGIEMMRNRQNSIRLSVARELAAELKEFIKLLPGVKAVSEAGSTRRWRDTVGDLDLVVAADDPATVLHAMAAYPRVKEVVRQESQRMVVNTWWGLAVDLQVADPAAYITTLHRNTGCKAHYAKLQEIAQQQGLHLNHRGLFNQAGQHLPIQHEQDIYETLQMTYIPPELREDRGEVEAARAGRLPAVIELGDIKGDLHIHTTWSDSALQLADVVQLCRRKGYAYAAITDHSRSLKIARGLEIERLQEQHRLIREMNEQMEDFTLLTGVEADILPNGELDYPDEILETMDVVIASVHTGFKQSKQEITRRIMRAMENEHVDIIAHMTGRILGRREPYEVDMEALIETAAKTKTALEINASPDRLDINEIYARKARDAGVKICINTDAHDAKRLDEMPYGVAVARRAWLEPGDVINTLDLPSLREVLR
ncbi:DNA polymerase/3'-5' exonuclease PolX [Desulforamulus hydrothermalis]|uniref:DNA polymerase beta n=1 Tax=Desulforamulus hydrothermalis Lam5 = DSM 18033 TaxID=1121428 RepID=K8EET2_9FIRM|nr:DNA polymerase/3'-5' exonuclease PolX [Desulforamulus hydrothermalis]CCO07261.1 PHP C-terminal domain protein [Desulforamulus hydrothermalis Lam5 = DSM 18033]SHG92574.1 DNA polymerase (family 10) [Desulforamulus hydrothermalis Lam5 = DSM 18033]